jgi:AraC-like DNA-binding protein
MQPPTSPSTASAPELAMSTDQVPPRERAAQWRDWVYRHFGGLDSDLYGASTGFDGHLRAARAGCAILTKLEADRHRVIKSLQLARGGDEAYLKIVAPWQGQAHVRQRGQHATASDGGWVIYDTTADYEIDNPERVEHLIVMLPKARVAGRDLKLEPLMAQRFGSQGISRVALETMRNTYLELPHMSDEAASGAGELLVQLVQMSLRELAGQACATSQRAALRDRIVGYVAQHLRDPQLSVDDIARALNCSRRHLYNAFAGEGESIAAYIQRQRLQACVRELQAAAQARPITDIALSWGFGNAAHFSRVFREHMGASPSEFRQARALAAPAPPRARPSRPDPFMQEKQPCTLRR